MKLSSLRTRILLSGVVTSTVTVALVWIAGSLAFHRLSDELDTHLVTEADAALCLRAPEAWSKEIGGFIAGFAYDAATGRAVNPAAPGLDPELAAQAPAPGASVRIGDGHGRTLLFRTAEAGPCSLFAVQVRPPPARVLHAHAAYLATGGAAAMLAVAALSWLLAVRPIVRRIQRARDAAGGVGQDGYGSAADRTGDELSRISEVLDASHARIRADRDELVARHEALERHLAEIAHDLRTPLASLLLATEELSEASPEDARALAARALEDTVYLDALVDNLRQATLLRHGLDPRAGDARADLCDIARRVGQRFTALGRRRGVEVAWAVPDEPIEVRCPPALAERAIANLVHNAVVHGRPDGHVALVVEPAAGGFCLTVLDDGPGVAPEAVADLAERTFRDDPARPRGQGLGLAIADEVCRRAGWTICYANREEGGLEVEVRGGRG